MEFRCASRLTQRTAAQALAPPNLSLVSNTLAILHLTPPYPLHPFPALGANRRLFPFNMPGPAPALPPAPTAHRRLICQSLPQPEPASTLHPGLSRGSRSPASIRASEAERVLLGPWPVTLARDASPCTDAPQRPAWARLLSVHRDEAVLGAPAPRLGQPCGTLRPPPRALCCWAPRVAWGALSNRRTSCGPP